MLQSIAANLPLLFQLLSSRIISDVKGVLSLVFFLFKTKVSNSNLYLRKLLPTVWHPDKAILSKFQHKFHKIFLTQ